LRNGLGSSLALAECGDAGKGNLADPKRFGTVDYNLGVVNGILNVDALRLAQEKGITPRDRSQEQ